MGINVREVEARNYWRAARQVNALRREPAPHPADMEDAVSELEAIVANSDWLYLRRLCIGLIALVQPVQALANVL